MTQTIDFTLLVHGQKGFGYTRHSEIGNINKYLGGNSVQLACPDRENLFETEKSLLSDDIGYFNPSGLTDYLRRKGIDSQEPTKININLVGGDFSKCLLKAFQITSIWTEKSPLFNKTTIFLPSDAVFDYYKEQNRPIVLSDPTFLLLRRVLWKSNRQRKRDSFCISGNPRNHRMSFGQT